MQALLKFCVVINVACAFIQMTAHNYLGALFSVVVGGYCLSILLRLSAHEE